LEAFLTSLLSSISGHFSRSIILGAFFPAAIFVLLGVVFVWPLLPATSWLAREVGMLDAEWRVALLTFIVVVLTGLLYHMNIPLLQLYEGYPWLETSFGRRSRYRRQLEAAEVRAAGYHALASQRQRMAGYRQEREANRRLAEAGQEWQRFARQNFPIRPELVLPTQLGNALRKAETYPQREYGMAAVTLWPRLIAVLKADYATALDNAKASLDFMINSSFLSSLTALLTLLLGLWYPVPLATSAFWWPWLLLLMAFAVAAFLLYRAAVGRAAAWGSLIEGAFDLYRAELLKQFGYGERPMSRQVERALWDRISRQIVFGDEPKGPRI
jgi:hypothetical protein